MVVWAREMILLLQEVAAFARRPEFGSAPWHPEPSSVLWHLYCAHTHKDQIGFCVLVFVFI